VTAPKRQTFQSLDVGTTPRHRGVGILFLTAAAQSLRRPEHLASAARCAAIAIAAVTLWYSQSLASPKPETAAPVAPPADGVVSKEEVHFPSNGYTLYGCIQRPAGRGPFPAVIYNHGSEQHPGRCSPPELARAYVEHGYLFFSFHRHGHGQSPGDYIGDLQKKIRAEVNDPVSRGRKIAALQDEYNRDVVGAVEWLKTRPEVDATRIAMTGVSYGGIQTLLTAENGLGIRAFIAFAPGAMSWRNPAVRQRLERAVRNAKAPIFLAQAQNDYSLGPSEVLGPMVRAKGPPNEAKIYPAFGTTHQQGHAGFAVRGGIPTWSPDVFAFLNAVMAQAGPTPGGEPPVGPRVSQQLPPTQDAPATTGGPAVKLAPAVRAACSEDVQQFCAGVASGGGRIIRCLEGRQSAVSDNCRSFLQRRLGQRRGNAGGQTGAPQAPATESAQRGPGQQRLAPALRAACGTDVQQFCSGVASGGGRIIRCLATRQAEVSASCQAFLQRSRNGPASAPVQGEVVETLPTPDGQTRSYVISRPEASGPLPTIVLLHGYGGNAQGTARISGLAQLGQSEGFVSVFPDGIAVAPGSAHHAWNHLPAKSAASPSAVMQIEGFKLPPGAAIPDDVAFLNALVADLVKRGISDPKRIYLAGISAGGFMTMRMTCTASEPFAAVALVISGMPNPMGADCHPRKPLPVVMIKGTADPNVPWNGGNVKRDTFAVWPQERLFEFFRQLDGCSSAAEESELPDQVPFKIELVSWTHCTKSGPIVLYRVINGVHAVPSDLNLAKTLWEFFRDKVNE